MLNKESPLRKLVGGWFDTWWEQFVESVLARHETRIRRLEARMATLEQFRTDVNDFTNELAGEIDGVVRRQENFQTQIDDLKAQLDAGNTAAVSAALDSLTPDVDRMRQVADKLRELGDPEAPNPIPEPLPEPTPEPGPTA